MVLPILACSPGADGPWELTGSAGTVIRDYSRGWPVAGDSGARLVEVRRFGDAFDGGLGFLASPQDLAVDDRGHVYVVDWDAHAVVVFDDAGNHLRSFGREGQGPGEFLSPRAVAVVGETLAVYDAARRGFSLFSLDGEFLRVVDHRFEGVVSVFGSGERVLVRSVRRVVEAAEAGAAGRSTEEPTRFDQSTSHEVALRALTIDDDRVDDVVAYPYRGILLRPNRLGIAYTEGYNEGSARVRDRTPSYASAGAGAVVVNPGFGPEIGRLGADGAWEWIVRMPLPRLPFSTDEIDRLTRPKKRGRQIEEGDLILPAHAPVFANLNTDGRGNVVVYPSRPDGRTVYNEPTTAYLFGADGEYLGPLETPFRVWDAAWGEYVYSIETDPETDEQVVVQRRLEL